MGDFVNKLQMQAQQPPVQTNYAQPWPQAMKVPPPNTLDLLLHLSGAIQHPGFDAQGNRVRNPLVVGDTINTPPPVEQIKVPPIMLEGPPPAPAKKPQQISATEPGTTTPITGGSRKGSYA